MHANEHSSNKVLMHSSTHLLLRHNRIIHLVEGQRQQEPLAGIIHLPAQQVVVALDLQGGESGQERVE